MTDDNEVLEPTPYENAYRRTLNEPDEESLDPAVEEAATPSLTEGIVQKEDHDYKKRYDDLKKHYDTKLNEWKQNREVLEAKLKMSDTPTQRINELPKTAEELESFREQYPDVYDVVETISSLKANDRVSEVEDHLEVLRQKEEEAERITAEKQLTAMHPDFTELKESDDFLKWLEEQPSSISDGVYRNNTDVRWAARVIDLYKADVGQTTTKSRRSGSNKNQREQAAQAVTRTASNRGLESLGPDKKIWTVEEISRLKPWEFDKYEKDIDAASREGRVVDSI
jgi:DNA repair exonuclease SbcCD ATPase subunit